MYVRGRSVVRVPEALPGNESLELVALTCIVKLLDVAAPPSLFTTFLMTTSVPVEVAVLVALMFVNVQVACEPTPSTTCHPEEPLAEPVEVAFAVQPRELKIHPDTAFSDTVVVPGLRIIFTEPVPPEVATEVVPIFDPLMLKSNALFPPTLFFTMVRSARPGGG